MSMLSAAAAPAAVSSPGSSRWPPSAGAAARPTPAARARTAPPPSPSPGADPEKAASVRWAAAGALGGLALGCLLTGWTAVAALAAAGALLLYAVSAVTGGPAARALAVPLAEAAPAPSPTPAAEPPPAGAPTPTAGQASFAARGPRARRARSLADELAGAGGAARPPSPRRSSHAGKDALRLLRAQLAQQGQQWRELEAECAGLKEAHATERRSWLVREELLERRLEEARGQVAPCLQRERAAAERLRTTEQGRAQLAAQLGVQAGELRQLRDRFGELEAALLASQQSLARARADRRGLEERTAALEASLLETGAEASEARRAWRRQSHAERSALAEAHEQLAEQRLRLVDLEDALRASPGQPPRRRIRSA